MDTVKKMREFLTRSRLTAAIGFATLLFGLLEVRGTFSHVAEPWSTVVVCVGALLTWAGRSGLAAAKPALAPAPEDAPLTWADRSVLTAAKPAPAPEDVL